MRRSSRCRCEYLFPKNKKKFVRQKGRGAEDEQTETRHAADDSSIKPGQFPRLLTAGKGGCKNVGNKIAEDGKDHGEAAECPDLGHGSRAMAKDRDKQDRDLALQTEEDRVRRLVADETNHRPAVIGIFLCLQIDDVAGVATQHEVLQQKSARTDHGSDAGIKENEGKADQDCQARNRPSEIDPLDLTNVRA